ncbi:uncharacterized protein C2845_PM01G44580 [Panicum miliaceum]|uniref:DUF8039 domain-containing protein n=1 Tax=Panicum miliaceum TaxID=4540 RepID=A0A3L6TI17_PANMI|nr:uncharacterized protein C2845_PM01G44580 [Panicum miliaceum]
MSSPDKCLGPSHDEQDTFDQLKGPTACSLVTGSFAMLLIELAQAVVLLENKVCHTVPVQDGYVVVKVDCVHENAEAYPLDIPVPNAEMFTLGDARTLWIQWKKRGVIISPLGRSIASSSERPSSTGAQSEHAAQLLVHFLLWYRRRSHRPKSGIR